MLLRVLLRFSLLVLPWYLACFCVQWTLVHRALWPCKLSLLLIATPFFLLHSSISITQQEDYYKTWQTKLFFFTISGRCYVLSVVLRSLFFYQRGWQPQKEVSGNFFTDLHEARLNCTPKFTTNQSSQSCNSFGQR